MTRPTDDQIEAALAEAEETARLRRQLDELRKAEWAERLERERGLRGRPRPPDPIYCRCDAIPVVDPEGSAREFERLNRARRFQFICGHCGRKFGQATTTPAQLSRMRFGCAVCGRGIVAPRELPEQEGP